MTPALQSLTIYLGFITSIFISWSIGPGLYPDMALERHMCS